MREGQVYTAPSDSGMSLKSGHWLTEAANVGNILLPVIFYLGDRKLIRDRGKTYQ